MRDETIQVPEPGKATWVVLAGFGVVLPLGILGVIALTADLSKVGGELLFGTLIVTLVMGVIIHDCVRYRDVKLLADHVFVRATIFRRRIPYTSIRPSSLRVADTRQDTQFRPWLKIGGVGLPGLFAGHFRLRGWKKAFLLVTEPRVVTFQLDNDSWVIFSARSPDRAAEALRARLPSASAGTMR